MTLDTGPSIQGDFSLDAGFLPNPSKAKIAVIDALRQTFSSEPVHAPLKRPAETAPKVPGWLRSLPHNSDTDFASGSGTVRTMAPWQKATMEVGSFAKLVTENALAGLGLVALLPLFLIVAIAIKIDTPGPVFFSQPRTGKNGRVFRILKFRTMTVQDNSDVKQATKNDARVTRVGSILRKTSIDELPQLINVIKGDMALVGPRPHAIQHDQYYGKIVPNYEKRFAVKPGLTGWAQINNLRGETETVDKMAQRVNCDLEYIHNMSYRLDILIIFLTPMVLLFHKNAY